MRPPIGAEPSEWARVVRWKGAAAENVGRPNSQEVNPRGQGPRGYGSAARRLPACESRGCGRRAAALVPLREPARPADRSRAAPGSTSS